MLSLSHSIQEVLGAENLPKVASKGFVTKFSGDTPEAIKPKVAHKAAFRRSKRYVKGSIDALTVLSKQGFFKEIVFLYQLKALATNGKIRDFKKTLRRECDKKTFIVCYQTALNYTHRLQQNGFVHYKDKVLTLPSHDLICNMAGVLPCFNHFYIKKEDFSLLYAETLIAYDSEKKQKAILNDSTAKDSHEVDNITTNFGSHEKTVLGSITDDIIVSCQTFAKKIGCRHKITGSRHLRKLKAKGFIERNQRYIKLEKGDERKAVYINGILCHQIASSFKTLIQVDQRPNRPIKFNQPI